MKKLFAGIVLFLFFSSLSHSCRANFAISPEQISIKMDKEFIYGNTLKKIVVTNNNREDFNVTWYLENPTPSSKIRPNRTTIPDLSWIDLEPKWRVIPPHETGEFFIYLNIPKTKDTINKKWETWITFKSVDKELFNIEYAIRLYINTPSEVTGIDDDDDDFFSIKLGDQLAIPLSSILIVILIVVVLFILSIIISKKKK